MAGFGSASTLIGPVSLHVRRYALVSDLEALLLPTSTRITFKLWQRVGAELIRDLLPQAHMRDRNSLSC